MCTICCPTCSSPCMLKLAFKDGSVLSLEDFLRYPLQLELRLLDRLVQVSIPLPVGFADITARSNKCSFNSTGKCAGLALKYLLNNAMILAVPRLRRC